LSAKPADRRAKKIFEMEPDLCQIQDYNVKKKILARCIDEEQLFLFED
jgi:hypothetical protein